MCPTLGRLATAPRLLAACLRPDGGVDLRAHAAEERAALARAEIERAPELAAVARRGSVEARSIPDARARAAPLAGRRGLAIDRRRADPTARERASRELEVVAGSRPR